MIRGKLYSEDEMEEMAVFAGFPKARSDSCVTIDFTIDMGYHVLLDSSDGYWFFENVPVYDEWSGGDE